MEKQPVLVRTILEILGAPKQHVEDALKKYVDSIRKVHKILEEKWHPAEQKESLFSAFCELEIQFQDVMELLDFCFESMPGSVEIIEPASLTLQTTDITDFLNDLQGRLHYADMTVKNLKAQAQMLDQNATGVFQNFIVRLVEREPMNLGKIAKMVGVAEDMIEPFVKRLVESKRIKKKDDTYFAEHVKEQA